LSSGFTSEPKLAIKGTATYHALGKDYYIANLYVTDSSQDALALLAKNKRQKMKIKVIAKHWSARKWKAQWQNNIVINNEVNTDPELAQAILDFTDFPISSLRKGDEVIIDYIPNIGSRVYFNTHQVIMTEDVKLYSYLLNTWLGKFSLNRVFREKISGITVPEDKLLVKANEALAQDRIDEVDSWFISEEEKRRAERELLIAEAIKKQQQEVVKRKALAKKKSDEAAKKNKMLLAAQKEAEQKKAEQKKANAIKKPKRRSLQYQMAMQDYYQQLYLWQLQSKVNKSVLYPKWTEDFSDKGLVEISFATDRAGDLLNVVNKTPDISSVLEQELVSNILLALKESPRPPELEGNRWSFTIHYLFDSTLKKRKPLSKPKAP
jgi:outer membrane biosynthesis protein TonB